MIKNADTLFIQVTPSNIHYHVERYLLNNERELTTEEADDITSIKSIICNAFPDHDGYISKYTGKGYEITLGTHNVKEDKVNDKKTGKNRRGFGLLAHNGKIGIKWTGQDKKTLSHIEKVLPPTHYKKFIVDGFKLSELTKPQNIKAFIKVIERISVLPSTQEIFAGNLKKENNNPPPKIDTTNSKTVKKDSFRAAEKRFNALVDKAINGELSDSETRNFPRKIQGDLKKFAISRFNKKCMITGNKIPKLIALAHIEDLKPKESDLSELDNEIEKSKITNVLLMDLHAHKLYDFGLLQISNTGIILVSAKLKSMTNEYNEYHGINIFNSNAFKNNPLTKAERKEMCTNFKKKNELLSKKHKLENIAD